MDSNLSLQAITRGGVSILLCNSLHFQIEVHQSFVPHVLIFHLAIWWKWWFIARCYFPPSNVAETDHIAMMLGHCLDGLDPILIVDLNVNSSRTKGG